MNYNKLIKRFVSLVKIDSESYHEEKIINYIKKVVEKLNGDFYFQQVRENTGNLIVSFKGNSNKKPIFFNAHLDTVTPGKNINPIITDKLIKSDGNTVLGSDDKAAVAIFLEGIEYILKNKIEHPDIYFVFTFAEEMGLIGAKHLDFTKIKAKEGYSFDGDGRVGTIILSAPTHYRYKIIVYGKSSHAGIAPEKGKNAILIASDLITKVKMGKIDNDTTANIGVISGGRATNIVPDRVTIEGEVRSQNFKKLKTYIKELKDKINKIKSKYKCKIKIDIWQEYKGFKFNENSFLVKKIVDACKKIKVKPIFEYSNGGSDANIFNQNGFKCLNIGIGMQKVHSTEEFILIKDLINGFRLFISLIENW